MELNDILDQIKKERQQQDDKWGGPLHDDEHTNFDWIAYITKHLGRAVMWPFEADIFRNQMIRVAALAVAAIQWVDRRTEEE
jgi:hypothetical protein